MAHGMRKELAVMAGLVALGLCLKEDKTWALAIGLAALALRFWPGGGSLRGRVVLITGGSRGLGLALAERFLREGARVAILARNADGLGRARAMLEERVPEAQVMTLTADITRRDLMAEAVARTEAQFGRLDVLVNNANAITLGPLGTMDRDDFQAQLDLQVHALVDAAALVRPLFRRQGGGRIVNIGSIGGRIPVPHLAAYCAGKFALAGLSEVMAAELAPERIRVTTVFPGMMRVGSPLQVVIKGDHEKEFAWFSLGDSIPGLAVSAEYAARKIVAGTRRGDRQVMFPATSKLAEWTHAAFPEWFGAALGFAARFFPRSESRERRTGAESRGWLERQSWYGLLRPMVRRMEARYNQQPPAGGKPRP